MGKISQKSILSTIDTTNLHLRVHLELYSENCLEIRRRGRARAVPRRFSFNVDMNIYFEKLPHKRPSEREPALLGHLLALELGVFGHHVFFPLDEARRQISHHLRHVAQRNPNLTGRVPLP